ncbi:MAG: type I-E CRISPR-associated protein Cas6/Cse3/CasE [Candidatus Lernaella stagnicola]|nr:type I-E CRISPR-associated protein Cas6/Cse3/CasE [Candidatus Lernaella stagnicola]
MYLSRLQLNPKSRLARHDFASGYQMHRTLSRAFPDADQGGCGKVLFRAEMQAGAGEIIVLVQSEKKPDWRAVAGRHLQYLSQPPESKPFDPAFFSGQRLRFRLRANPTRKVNGKRLGHLTAEHQQSWFERKGEHCGFAVQGVMIRSNGLQKDEGKSGPNEMTFVDVTFDGVLEVTDPERFGRAVREGIGSGKGVGFGLLSVAPAGG